MIKQTFLDINFLYYGNQSDIKVLSFFMNNKG